MQPAASGTTELGGRRQGRLALRPSLQPTVQAGCINTDLSAHVWEGVMWETPKPQREIPNQIRKTKGASFEYKHRVFAGTGWLDFPWAKSGDQPRRDGRGRGKSPEGKLCAPEACCGIRRALWPKGP